LVLLENVTGFLTSNKGRDFGLALEALNDLGYQVDAFVLDASHFVPQSRRRLFVVASQNGADSESGQNVSALTPDSLRPAQLIRFMQDHPKIDWTIRPLPEPPICKRRLRDIVNDPPEGKAPWWASGRRDYLLSQMSPKHRAQAVAMTRGSEFSYGSIFRRVRKGTTMAELRTDGIAGCLRTPRGGSARQILLRAGRGTVEIRLLQPDECARLMGLDDQFIIDASLNQALFALGDAVCVPAIEWIAEEYLNKLAAPICVKSEVRRMKAELRSQ
jgi:DNA (cytosine-5)-methyltransferase 1